MCGCYATIPGMARRMRVEVEGGLYHVITRGVDRQDIFHDEQDHARFVALLGLQKSKLPFYLYAYCLMTNHIHLLIERMTDDVGRIMQRVLTGYAQYYNRRYRRSGHVLQGRHKAILCQSDAYLTELVRYIHLNPVRAKMVERPEEYPYSSHRAYLGTEAAAMVDVDPVLRHFGPKKDVARERFAQFVDAGAKLGHDERFYATTGGMLGSDEFVDSMIHRIGEHDVYAAARRRNELKAARDCDTQRLLAVAANVFQIGKDELCSRGKSAGLVEAKEVLILSGRRLGASLAEMSDLLNINPSTTGRRYDAAKRRIADDHRMSETVENVIRRYESRGQ